jgi:hypothetical protein
MPRSSPSKANPIASRKRASETNSAPTTPPSWATTIVIPTTWTPEQALAVFELLEDLRETVATLYLDQIQAQLRQEQRGGGDTATDADVHNQAGDDLTF